MQTINIIGAGRLGQTLGYLWTKYQIAEVQSILNTSEKSTLEAIEFIKRGRYCARITDLPPADVTLISSSDDQICLIAEALAAHGNIKANSLILHCSGVLNSDELSILKQKNALIVSVHPMQSFAKPSLSIERFEGTYCAIEGDAEGVMKAQKLFESIGAITYKIDKKHKAAYHAAGVFASNYVVTLAQQALDCMQLAGVEDTLAMKVITKLMAGTVSNLTETLSPTLSLTGPLKRGDQATIEKHLKGLKTQKLKKLYAILGQATLPLSGVSKAVRQRFLELFKAFKFDH